MSDGQEKEELQELNQVLQWMVREGLCEMGINDDNEFVFWMTDQTKDEVSRRLDQIPDDDTDMIGEAEEWYDDYDD